jgi:hypothetical protein
MSGVRRVEALLDSRPSGQAIKQVGVAMNMTDSESALDGWSGEGKVATRISMQGGHRPSSTARTPSARYTRRSLPQRERERERESER